VYHSCVISNRYPFTPPALPGINATMDSSDFRAPPPASSLFRLVRGCPPPASRYSDLLGYRVLSMSGSTWPRTPGSTRIAGRGAIRIVACERAKTLGTLRPKFSGLNTFKVGSTRYLYTSPAFVPTHRHARYRACRKARYWARGSRLPRWDLHPLDYATLPSRTDPLFPPAIPSCLALPVLAVVTGSEE